VTAAAPQFCVAMRFATSEIIFIKELGIGTALAAIIDAALIRALLVPSLMRCSAKPTCGRRRRCGAYIDASA
jgi:uncharacterized membrane protein YdfJ with MMPL/SSD domain